MWVYVGEGREKSINVCATGGKSNNNMKKTSKGGKGKRQKEKVKCRVWIVCTLLSGWIWLLLLLGEKEKRMNKKR